MPYAGSLEKLKEEKPLRHVQQCLEAFKKKATSFHHLFIKIGSRKITQKGFNPVCCDLAVVSFVYYVFSCYSTVVY